MRIIKHCVIVNPVINLYSVIQAASLFRWTQPGGYCGRYNVSDIMSLTLYRPQYPPGCVQTDIWCSLWQLCNVQRVKLDRWIDDHRQHCPVGHCNHAPTA